MERQSPRWWWLPEQAPTILNELNFAYKKREIATEKNKSTNTYDPPKSYRKMKQINTCLLIDQPTNHIIYAYLYIYTLF